MKSYLTTRRITKSLIFMTLAAVICSCEKEIELDYRSVAPVYVVEAFVQNEGQTKVKITTTRDVTDPSPVDPLTDAVVTLTDSEGRKTNFSCDDDGYFRPVVDFEPEAYETYTIAIDVDGQSFVAQSVMQEKVEVDSAKFIMYDIIILNYLILEINFNDIVDVDNYYSYRLYRNGELYCWDVFKDQRSANETFTKHVMLLSQDALENPDPESEKQLYEGDLLTLELYTIDRATYDYLSSVGVISSTSANPITNFEGGCLGYFSAQAMTTCDITFHMDEIQR